MTHSEDRLELTQLILALLQAWGITNFSNLISVLSLPVETRGRTMRRYGSELPLPDLDPVNERIEHLVGIADALRTTYPMNPMAGHLWMRRPNHRFSDQSPAQRIVEHGLEALVEIRSHLDCSYDWHVDDLNNRT